MAYGDIFMPTAIPSGKLQLIAYTHDEELGGFEVFSKSDITHY